MSARILQINFKLNVSPAEYESIVTPLGNAFAAVDGLQWKIWLLNASEREAGGIYLFDNDAAVDTFLDGPLVAEVKKAPFLRELSVKRFEVMDEVTVATRGPVTSGVGA